MVSATLVAFTSTAPEGAGCPFIHLDDWGLLSQSCSADLATRDVNANSVLRDLIIDCMGPSAKFFTPNTLNNNLVHNQCPHQHFSAFFTLRTLEMALEDFCIIMIKFEASMISML